MHALAANGFIDWIDTAGVLGLWEVIKSYRYFRKQFDMALEEVRRINPSAVVLIDYPGFNLRFARALRRNTGFHSAKRMDSSRGEPGRPAGVPPADSAPTGRARDTDKTSVFRGKIIYYISPQVWAWNRGRIKRMARCLDLMLCIFPFEADLYNQSGLRTLFVGHPMIDNLRARRINTSREANLVALFPGSRRREVRKILPIVVETARLLCQKRPQLAFEIAAASPEIAALIQKMLDGEQFFRVTTGDAAALMQRASVGVVASGSATLEAAYFRLPFVLVYKVSWATYLAARAVVKIKVLGMPNVLAGRAIVAEFIQRDARPRRIAEAVDRLLNDSVARDDLVTQFDHVIAKLGEGGASDKAADAILDEINAG